MSSQYYRGLLQVAKKKLADYKTRKSQLETIRNNYSRFDSYAVDLNSYCTSASTNGRSGILLSGGSNDLDSVFEKNDGGSGDGNLSCSRNYINAEIQRVQGKINELEQNINTYTTKMKQEEKKEKEAAEKAKAKK